MTIASNTFGVVALLLILTALAVVLIVTTLQKAARLVGRATPSRVNPEPEASPRWSDPGRIKRLGEEFRALGFEEIGAFQIPELGELRLLAFLHPGERFYAAIYDHESAGPTFDVSCRFEDGSSLTGINAALDGSLPDRPGHRTVALGGQRVEEVWSACQQAASGRARKPVSASDFVPYFKKAYAEGTNWRLKQGPASREDIRRQAEREGRGLSDRQVEATYASLRASHLGEVQEGCVAQYLDEQALTEEELERRGTPVFAVPGIMEAGELIEFLATVFELDEHRRRQLEPFAEPSDRTAVEQCRGIIAGDVASLGLREIGQVTEPVPAIIVEARNV